MFEVFKFIFKQLGALIKVLFDIDLGFISLGGLICCTFILLPIILRLLGVVRDESGSAIMEDYRAAKYVRFKNNVKRREKE